MAADPYNFDPRFERAMVFLACSRPAFYGSTGYALEVEALAAPEARLALTAAHAVFTDIGRGPDGLVIVLQRLRRMVDPGGRVTMAEVQAVDDYFTAAEEDARFPLPTEEQAVAELAPLLRRRMEKTIVRAAGDTYSKRGNMNALVRLVNEAGRIGRVNISLGTKLGPEMAEEIAAMRHMERLSTGVLELDTILDGGLPRGSLGVVVADTGGGKSLALAQVAAAAVLAGLFVVVATLEVPRPVWLSRVLSNITGIPINTILAEGPHAALAMLSAYPSLGALIVEEFTADATTIADLEEWTKVLGQREGRTPDVVIVDYFDKLIPEEKQPSEYLACKKVYEAGRVCAQKAKTWWWTASQSKGDGGNGKHKKETLTTSDLADSKHKARVADLIVTLNPRSEGAEVLFHVAKFRHGKAGGSVGPLPHDFACARVAPPVFVPTAPDVGGADL